MRWKKEIRGEKIIGIIKDAGFESENGTLFAC
jgi:hypothetical protein